MGLTRVELNLINQVSEDTDSDATPNDNVLSGVALIAGIYTDNTQNTVPAYTKATGAAAFVVGTTAPTFQIRTREGKASTVTIHAPASAPQGGLALESPSNLSFATVTGAGKSDATSPTNNVLVRWIFRKLLT